MILYVIFSHFLPLIFFLMAMIWPGKQGGLKPISNISVIVLAIIMIFVLGTYPTELSSDKGGYVFAYLYKFANELDYDDIRKDPGWATYLFFMNKILGDNETIFFIITATIYVMSSYVYARKMFGKDYCGYFVILTMGCLGFVAYGINTIRSGFALALLFWGMSLEKRWKQILLVILAVFIHKSMLIPIAAYIAAYFMRSRKAVYGIWLVCLMVSIVNVDLTNWFENIGFIDARVESYVGSISAMTYSNDDGYNRGFRIDFIMYSLIPLVVNLYYKKQNLFIDKNYDRVVNAYLLANAVWLLVIRMAHSDRMAYLSWFMIPFIILYPVLTYKDRFNNPRIITYMSMLFMMGITSYMAIRTISKILE